MPVMQAVWSLTVAGAHCCLHTTNTGQRSSLPAQVQSELTEMIVPTLFLSSPAMTCTVSPVYIGMGCLMGLPFLLRG